MSYYIETSLGTVYFDSDNIEKLVIIADYNRDITKIENTNMETNLLEKLYDWDHIRVKNTINGLFMVVELSDSHYGYPEYKIYDV